MAKNKMSGSTLKLHWEFTSRNNNIFVAIVWSSLLVRSIIWFVCILEKHLKRIFCLLTEERVLHRSGLGSHEFRLKIINFDKMLQNFYTKRICKTGRFCNWFSFLLFYTFVKLFEGKKASIWVENIQQNWASMDL